MPAISIIIPCYNAQATLADTLRSLVGQSVTDWEAICVDDGSDDATCRIIRDAARRDGRIRLERNAGKGPSHARNQGALVHARAPLLAFCDADDQWPADKLADVLDCFADATVGAVFGKIGFFNDRPQDARVFSAPPAGDLTIPVLLGENPVCTMSNLSVRRALFARTGGFDTQMVHNEDLEWLIRLVGTGMRVVARPQLHCWYRTTRGGLSTDLDRMLAGRARALKTAARFGHAPDGRSHAIHHRYLARRALRLDLGARVALRHAAAGLRHSPAGFFSPVRRGVLTLAGALLSPALPRALRTAIFA